MLAAAPLFHPRDQRGARRFVACGWNPAAAGDGHGRIRSIAVPPSSTIRRAGGEAAMSFKDFLVFVDALPGGDERLDLAVALARQHDAHLTAVHVVRPPEVPGAPGRVYFETILDTALEQPEREAATLEEAFLERLRREGLLGEWRVIRRDSRDQPAVHARYADLVIAGQVREHSRAAGPGAIMPAELAIVSGRPVIVAPDTTFRPMVGENLLIAWKPTREAVRAIAEAMPLLRRASA
jgi:nucleotide-binding universal stress UspA family protein